MKLKSILLLNFIFIVIIFLSRISLATSEGQSSTGSQETNPAVVMVLIYDKNTGQHRQATGFFLNIRGDVVTNFHAVEGNNLITIRTTTGEGYPAREMIKKDILGDLAVLSVDIPAAKVHPVTISFSPSVRGSGIFVVGHPLGHSQRVSKGEITGLFPVKNFGNIVQFSAPISVGSSGSPVFNQNGEVVAIASFMLFTGKQSHMNFAVQASRLADLNLQ